MITSKLNRSISQGAHARSRALFSSLLLPFRVAMIMAALLSMAGCAGSLGGSAQSELHEHPGTPASRETQGVLTPSSSSVSFGNVMVGTSTAQLVSLKNTGRSNVKISSVSVNGNDFTVSGGSNATLTPDKSVTISVNFSASGEGKAQGQVSVSSNASNPLLTIAITATGVVQPAQHTVNLSWQPSTSSVAGYHVYRGSTVENLSRLTGTADTATTYSDSSVQNGQTYVYAVSSVDSKNAESAQSDPITVTIPSN